MDPAYSVILFTASSGAGYGLLVWLALARLSGAWEASPALSITAGGVALALVTVGLLSSTFHLGHPERAWRAVTQWRSSWLSREGVLALLTYPAALLFLAGWLWNPLAGTAMDLAAAATALLSLATVYSTGMIYASLKTIPRWHHPLVPVIYLALALASGGLLFAVGLSLSGAAAQPALLLLLAVLLLAWALKDVYWRVVDRRKPRSDTGTATGLGHLGEVRQLESPHTSENYLLKEMGYQVARRHADRLRHYARALGLVLPALLLLFALRQDGLEQTALLALAVLSGLAGVLVERWLFFAEARHLVTLYYGRAL
ncbi:MAG: DmsC/YnfH family molybdoenzyme membrane anchor subunit [Xanthomonadales bacterium]|nr:DmsC/YnfH family molybdoenzyme membrane anchor subunit [Xanthomonadales bacterium]